MLIERQKKQAENALKSIDKPVFLWYHTKAVYLKTAGAVPRNKALALPAEENEHVYS